METINLDLPYALSDINADEAVGIWADREKSAEEIARAIRDANNGKSDRATDCCENVTLISTNIDQSEDLS